MTTVAELLRRRAGTDATALRFGDGAWTYRDQLDEARRRAALFEELRDDDRPPHIGVLLDNVPEYIFWLSAAALSGSVIVGINSTYRGEQLGQLIRHTDCQVLVTARGFEPLLAGGPPGILPDRVLLVDDPDFTSRLPAPDEGEHERSVSEEDLFLLIFTSGSTGLPKAVRCTQGRLARTGAHVATIAPLGEEDVIYSPLPFFHSSSLFTGWSAAFTAGIPISTRARFSASNTLPDVRRFGATMLTYTGKVLNYILATPEQPDDAESPLRLAIGNEASSRDIREFARRFGCAVRDSYGSTEGIIIIRRDPSMPEGALGTADPTVKVLDPETGVECPPVAFASDGRPANLEQAVGEIVETAPTSGFEGYYRNDDATAARFRGGWYWSGDLASGTATGGCTSRAGPTSGCAWTARTSPPPPSRRSSAGTPTSARWRYTPCPTTPSAIGSWSRSSCATAPGSTPPSSTGSSPASPTSAPSGCRRSCRPRPSCPSWPA